MKIVAPSFSSRFYSSLTHPFHLVDGSPYPLLMSLAILGFAVSVVSWLTGFSTGYLGFAPIALIILISFLWFRDIIREAAGGYHTSAVQRGLLIGFLLFLVSEIMLFFSFFWSFLDFSLSPGVEIGASWPPVGITAIDPWALPLLGTCVLLASGFTVTAAHHAIVAGNKYSAIISLFFTVILGFAFVILQGTEYYFAPFAITDSAFGSVFFMTTGLHGLHVFCGALFLLVGLIRLFRENFTSEHHLGIEFAIFYWHLVDVVWLLVFF
jgi:cytochrome c oxidase subunit 3